MNRLQLELLILLCLSILSYCLDLFTSKERYKDCYTTNAQGLLFLHHIFITFVYFGVYFIQSKLLLKILFISIVLTFIHWWTNDNKCVLTQWLNQMCNIDGGLRSVANLVGMKTGPGRVYQKIYMCFILLLSCIKLYNY